MKKRSGSPEGTDDPRTEKDVANGPATGEPHQNPAAETPPAGPPRAEGEGSRPPRRRRGGRRREDRASGQGSLFAVEPRPAEGEPAESGAGGASRAQDARQGAESEPGHAAGQGAKKSRSKRRRDRRKAKAASAKQGVAGAESPIASKPAQGNPDHQRPPERESPGGGQRRESQDQRRRGNQPPQHKRGGYADGRGRPGAQYGNRQGLDQRRDGRSAPPSPPVQRRYPADGERLTTLGGLDFASGNIPDFGEDGDIPRFVSNLRPSPRAALRKQAPAVRPLESLAPSYECLAVLESLQKAIDETFPLHGKHREALKGDIRELWEELTSDRESRSVDYLSTPPALSAYIRYFLPWNVYRLSSILSNADFCLPDNAVIADIGSGPLTFPIALWASRPELRDLPITIYCVDRVERALEAGKALFETFCLRAEGRLPPWHIELRKDSFGANLPERAHLLTAANVFNEFFWKDKRPLGERALEVARNLLSYLRVDGSLFVMEPGDPRSGAFISALRAALLSEGAAPLGPCPHSLSCPMPGIFRHLLPPEETRVVRGDPNAAPSRFILPPVAMPKKRDKFPWCHFGIDADAAPAWLKAVSDEAGLPKERAVLSYLWAARGAAPRPFGGIPDPVHSSEKDRRAKAARGTLVRVISEPFALSDGTTGQYACSSLGYTMVKRPRGEAAYEPGSLLEVSASPLPRNDEKSGAIVLPT